MVIAWTLSNFWTASWSSLYDLLFADVEVSLMCTDGLSVCVCSLLSIGLPNLVDVSWGVLQYQYNIEIHQPLFSSIPFTRSSTLWPIETLNQWLRNIIVLEGLPECVIRHVECSNSELQTNFLWRLPADRKVLIKVSRPEDDCTKVSGSQAATLARQRIVNPIINNATGERRNRIGGSLIDTSSTLTVSCRCSNIVFIWSEECYEGTVHVHRGNNTTPLLHAGHRSIRAMSANSKHMSHTPSIAIRIEARKCWQMKLSPLIGLVTFAKEANTTGELITFIDFIVYRNDKFQVFIKDILTWIRAKVCE